MSEKCNTTAAWLNTDRVLRLLDDAEKRAREVYDTELEAAIVERTGVTVLVEGWRGWLLKITRITTREDAVQKVKKTHGDSWWCWEYYIRNNRDEFLKGVSQLRQVALVCNAAQEFRIYVSKDDMRYLS